MKTLSSIASSIVRQLEPGGHRLNLAVRHRNGSQAGAAAPLLQGALFIFLALFFDLLQYLVGTFTWFLYFRKKERAGRRPDEGFSAPAWINWPTWFLFSVKAACMLVT